MEKIVFDTNILIEILKGNSQIVSFVETLDADICISSISKMELLYGARDKKELKELEGFCSLFECIELDNSISKLATKLIATYAKSHNLNIPDALIASTCIEHKFKLFTLNLKDFRYMKDLVLLDFNSCK